MKKLLSILFAFVFISWNTASVNPEKAPAFNPLYYRMHHMTPLFVLMARPENSSNIGISFGTEVWESEQIDATTFRCSGMRSTIVRVPDSAYQTDMYGKKVIVRFAQMVTKWDYRVWTDRDICSGSGSCSVSSQGVFQRGDRALILAGTYTGGGGFSNTVGVAYIPKTVGHTVTVSTNGWGFRSIDSCELAYINFIGISGNALDMRAYINTFTAGNGPIQHTYLHNLYFSGVTGACINANGGLRYIPGDSSTASWLDVAIDSVNEDQSGLLCQGSFGSPVDNSGQPPAVMVRPSITRFISTGTTSTTNRGTELRGIFFELIAKYIIMIDTSGLGNSGDCGIFYGHGNGVEAFAIKIGGPGYQWRASPTREIGRPGIDWFFNCMKFFTTDYGQFQVQNPDTITNAFGAVDEIWYTHCTAGRMGSDNNYWCQGIVMGDLNCTGGTVNMKMYVKDNLLYEVTDWANGGAGHDNGTYKSRVLFNMGTGANLAAIDSSNNQYFPTLAGCKLDTVSTTTINGYIFPKFLPTINSGGNIVNGGTTVPISSTDYYGNPYNGIIGYAAIAGAAPPSCNPCTQLPGYKYSTNHP